MVRDSKDIVTGTTVKKGTSGQVLLDVDDFAEGGDEHHRKAIDGLYKKYKCGNAVDLVRIGSEGT